MTLIGGLVASYILIVAATCRVFRSIHRRDEEIEQMMRDGLATSAAPRMSRTGA